MPLADPRSTVAARPTKPVAAACAKNVPTPTSIRPAITAGRLGSSKSGSPTPASAKALQKVGRVPNRCAAAPANGVVTTEGKNTKYTKPNAMRPSEGGSRTSTKFT